MNTAGPSLDLQIVRNKRERRPSVHLLAFKKWHVISYDIYIVAIDGVTQLCEAQIKANDFILATV